MGRVRNLLEGLSRLVESDAEQRELERAAAAGDPAAKAKLLRSRSRHDELSDEEAIKLADEAFPHSGKRETPEGKRAREALAQEIASRVKGPLQAAVQGAPYKVLFERPPVAGHSKHEMVELYRAASATPHLVCTVTYFLDGSPLPSPGKKQGKRVEKLEIAAHEFGKQVIGPKLLPVMQAVIPGHWEFAPRWGVESGGSASFTKDGRLVCGIIPAYNLLMRGEGEIANLGRLLARFAH